MQRGAVLLLGKFWVNPVAKAWPQGLPQDQNTGTKTAYSCLKLEIPKPSFDTHRDMSVNNF
eukprot:4530268-Amphidinium_carterae.1